MLAMGILSWLMYFIIPVSKDSVAKEKKEKPASDFSFFKEPLFYLCTLTLFFYLCAEQGVIGWMITYFKDTGLLIASLDEEAQEDLRANKNLGTYKGAIYENIVGDMLVKQGYSLFYYHSDKPALEMDFFVRDADSLIPVEVKANDGATASLNNLLKEDKYPDVKYGIKLGYKNIGFNGKFYTFPYFLAFLLRKFIAEKRNM